MQKSCTAEIIPDDEQKRIITETFGVCRFGFNRYITHNRDLFEKDKTFLSGTEFTEWFYNEFILDNPDYSWINEVNPTSVKQYIMEAEQLFSSFVQGLTGFPDFKSKKKSELKMLFADSPSKDEVQYEQDRISIPTLGWVHIAQEEFLPADSTIISIRISKSADRYYVTVLAEVPCTAKETSDIKL